MVIAELNRINYGLFIISINQIDEDYYLETKVCQDAFILEESINVYFL